MKIKKKLAIIIPRYNERNIGRWQQVIYNLHTYITLYILTVTLPCITPMGSPHARSPSWGSHNYFSSTTRSGGCFLLLFLNWNCSETSTGGQLLRRTSDCEDIWLAFPRHRQGKTRRWKRKRQDKNTPAPSRMGLTNTKVNIVIWKRAEEITRGD